ncbi:hypothetical protein [Pseudorhizobium marinum]|uniref:hypothetical protein n=1 Tax=Pseudorhizobium marinum TaxID=1496690 RepID=UPI00056C8D83|nr:hypothetical protein [Pseudorhizobium marinum]
MAVIDILPPEPVVRHVRRGHPGRGGVVDAEFITVARAARDRRFRTETDNRSQSQSDFRRAVTQSPSSTLMERAEKALCRLSADMFSAVVALVFLLVFGLAGGFSLFMGKTNGAVEAPLLDFTHVTLTPQDVNGMRVLLINGIVENRSTDRLQLPAIRADLVTDGHVLATTVVAPPVAGIEGLQSHGFSSRIPHPGGKTPELKLSFATQDASSS